MIWGDVMRRETKHTLNIVCLNHLETIPSPASMEKLSSPKPVPGAKKVGDCCPKGRCNRHLCYKLWALSSVLKLGKCKSYRPARCNPKLVEMDFFLKLRSRISVETYLAYWPFYSYIFPIFLFLFLFAQCCFSSLSLIALSKVTVKSFICLQYVVCYPTSANIWSLLCINTTGLFQG